MFTICLALFQVTVEVPALEFLQYGSFLTFQIMEIFVISKLGDYLSTSVSFI